MIPAIAAPGAPPDSDRPAWQPPPPRPRLAPGDVHVWRLALDLPPAAVAALEAAVLAPDERARAARLRRAGDGGRFGVARARLRQVLAAYLDGSPAALRFAVDAAGKPGLVEPGPSTAASGGRIEERGPAEGIGLAFNLSHSEGVAIVAVASDGRVGVDVEAVRPRAALAAIAARYFDPSERAWLADTAAGLPGDAADAAVDAAADAAVDARANDDTAVARSAAFYTVWTAKEALTKAVGTGLSAGFRRFTVAVAADGALAVASDAARGPGSAAATGADEGWTLQRLPLEPGFIGALAVDRPAVAVAHFDGPPR